MKHVDSRILWLQEHCCGRCKIEEDTEDTKFVRYVDAYTRCEGGWRYFYR